MHCKTLTLLLCVTSLVAQSPQKPVSKPAPAKGMSSKATAPQGSVEAETARKTLLQVLDAIDTTLFGKTYQGVTSANIQGSLGISLSGQAVNTKVDSLSQGQVKANSKGGNANLKLNGVYFANGDFRTELSGDFGNLIYTRRANRGFLYSREQNAYTTRIDLAPTDAPNTYMAWFRQTLNDIKAVYASASIFSASTAGEESSGGRVLERIVFNAPTKTWDAKKREQSVAETLGFWKRGRLELAVDKITKLPHRIEFRNDEQGVQSRLDFSYGPNGKLQAASLSNQSKGFEGPGSLRIGYGSDGLISSLAGELTSQNKRVVFDLNLSWSKDRKSNTIATVPPAGASKKGREDLETGLLVNLAGQILDLQRNGLNLRSVTLASN